MAEKEKKTAEESLEYRFYVHEGGIRVSVSPDTYCHSLKLANGLAVTLKEKIPFSFDINDLGPEVVYLGGRRKKRMMSIEMCIRPRKEVSTKKAVKMLIAAGFIEGMEESLS